MEEELRKEVSEAVIALCKWIKEKSANGASGEELQILPGLVSATAELYNLVN